MGSKEIAVFGAGPAGLSSAYHLAKEGHQITLIKSETKPSFRSVYTKLSDSEQSLFFPEQYIQPVPRLRVLTTGGTDFTVFAQSPYAMVHYPGALGFVEQKLLPAQINVQALPQKEVSQVKIFDFSDKTEVWLSGSRQKYDQVIDCTGIEANILSQVTPDRQNDFLVEYVFGGVFRGRIEPKSLMIIVGPAGGTCWANPSMLGSDCIDIVFSAWGWRSFYHRFKQACQPRLKILVDFLKDKQGVHLFSSQPEELFGGMICSQPNSKPTTHHVFAVGEAAGMAKPKTGDSYRRALTGGRLLAKSISQDKSPSQFYHRWRRLWWTDNFFVGFVLARLASQKEGKNSVLVDKGYERFFSDKRQAKAMVEMAEAFFTEEKISPRLLSTILADKEWRQFLLTCLQNQLAVFRNPAKITPFWSLAP